MRQLSLRRFALMSVLFVFAMKAEAQILRFERLTQEDGLTQNFVNAIAQDRFGFIWIGTQDGLNRYDGYEVLRFRAGGEGSLQHAHIRSIVPGRSGLWVGTRGGGLSRYDPERERFTTWRHDPERPESLADDLVSQVLEDRAGYVWVGLRDGGLHRFDRQLKSLRRFLPDESDPTAIAGKAIVQLFEDTRGRLWVSFRGGGLDLYDPASGAFTHFAPEAGGQPVGTIAAIADAGDGRLWLGSATGVSLWSPLSGESEALGRLTGGEGRPESVAVLLVDGRGNLWIGTRSEGIVIRSPRGELLQTRHDPANPTSIPGDAVETLFEDRSGVIWAGTRLGVARHDPATAAFQVYRPAPGITNGPTGSYVWAAAESTDGSLWVGLDRAGLNRWDRTAGTWTSWVPDATRTDALASDSVTAILQRSDGNLWIGGNGGLSLFDFSTGTFRNTREPLPSPRVFTLLEGRDGTLWAGTGKGLVRLPPNSNTVERVGRDDFYPAIFSLAETADGTIWLGTFSNGLYSLDPSTGMTGRLAAPDGTVLLTEERAQQITALHAGSDGRLWIGTPRGLLRYDPGAATVRTYGLAEGMPDEAVMGIEQDQSGAFWISTNSGFTRLDPKTDSFRSYTTRDGLPSNEFNQMASGVTRAGEMMFGSIAGLVLFHPDRLVQHQGPPDVVIDGLEISNERVPIGERGEGGPNRFTLDRSILRTDSLTLSHREPVVTFTFAALHFADPRANRYAYRLEGWDRNWVETPSSRRTATYTNLPAGQFRFRVRASNKDGVWNEAGKAISIRVLPPPWKSWWAYTLYAIAALAVIAAFFSVRMRALRARQRELEALVQLRTAELAESERRALEANAAKSIFLANMSHELRTPLNAVLGFSRLLERSPRVVAGEREQLGIIRRSGEHLLGLINDVLSLSKIEAGRLTLDQKPFRLHDAIASVEMMMRGRAERAGLELVVEYAGELPAAVRGDEAKLRQVLINLLGNALKFTEQGRVILRVRWSENRARFEVEDTGTGIAPSELQTLFEPFVQTESGRKAKEGTGLGLVITREIVRLMGGDIDVRSTEGKGTCFTVEIALPESAEMPAAEEETRVIGLEREEAARRILVADDTPENRLLLVQLLGGVGFAVIEATNGEEALREWAARHPDVILMDTRMPVLDGRAATRRIREIEQRDGLARTPVIALTASAFEHERDQILADGADEFLAKPFREAALFHILERHTGCRFTRERGADELPAERLASRETIGLSHIARLSVEEAEQLHTALGDGLFAKAADVASRITVRDEALGRDLLADIQALRIDHLLDLLEVAAEHRQRNDA